MTPQQHARAAFTARAMIDLLGGLTLAEAGLAVAVLQVLLVRRMAEPEIGLALIHRMACDSLAAPAAAPVEGRT